MIKVISTIKLHNNGNIRGFADIELSIDNEKIYLKGFRILQTADKETGEIKDPWISMPSTEFINKDGEKKYPVTTTFSKHLKDIVCDAILHDFKALPQNQ